MSKIMNSFVGGGDGNWATGTKSVVGGGDTNLATGANTFIGGGYNNQVSGQLNGIIGGANNNDAGLAGVMIAGNNITAVNNNALHIEGLWACAIPGPGYGGGITNTVYYDVFPTLPPPWNACKVLMIW